MSVTVYLKDGRQEPFKHGSDVRRGSFFPAPMENAALDGLEVMDQKGTVIGAFVFSEVIGYKKVES